MVSVPLPQVGANDTHAVIVEWSKGQGDPVRKGEIICIAETTKSIFDIEAPADGYLTLLVDIGGEIAVGEAIAVIAPHPVTPDQARERMAAVTAPTASVEPVGAAAATWTFKAEMTAREHGLDVRLVPSVGDRVTEADVLAYVAAQARPQARQPEAHDLVDDRYPAGRVERLLIVGGGEGAVQVLDVVAKLPGLRAVAIVDDNRELQGRSVAGVPVIGGVDTERVAEMFARREFDAAVISVSTSIPFRERIFNEWKSRGIRFANILHPSVQVGLNVSLGEGNILLAFCQIGPCATIGDNNFLSAYCSLEHHGLLGSHCSFGPGVVTSSRANIGDRVRFGTGIFIEPHVAIGRDSVIGSGCILRADIPERSILKSRLNYSIRQRS